MRRIRARHHRFGRRAAGIDARAAEQLTLDQGDCQAGSRQTTGEKRSRLTGSDDDCVKIFSHATLP